MTSYQYLSPEDSTVNDTDRSEPHRGSAPVQDGTGTALGLSVPSAGDQSAGQGTIRWTGFPRIWAVQVVTSFEVSDPN